MPGRAFEDFRVGDIVELGPMLVTGEAVKSFAAQFDPQPMHLDESAVQNTILDGLSASGLHTVCMHMRLLADGLLRDSRSLGSPGVEEVRYLAPVRPGDRLTLRLEVLEARVSKSRPRLGIVRFRSHMVNADGKPVIRLMSTLLIGRREAASAQAAIGREAR